MAPSGSNGVPAAASLALRSRGRTICQEYASSWHRAISNLKKCRSTDDPCGDQRFISVSTVICFSILANMGWANGQYLWLVKVRQWWWRSTILRVARWQDHPGSVWKFSDDFNPCRWEKDSHNSCDQTFQLRFPSFQTQFNVVSCFLGIMVSNRLFMRSAKKSALVLQRSSLVVLRESNYLSVVISVDSWIQSPTKMLGKSCWNS